ncbi:Inactive glucose-1-phosphate adenylyltransferase small subunit 2 [Hibiscus syriacus]|uniref:Inactive glucose-1-phosphate adenylyltransferase small subunit 2 n=1 Tax=Hibiscus syriacus TaxID=106335 RepID=A0A6A3CXF0_HIBSY|nr:Inactive glucose-1-phosphate adenylyltransferase small subunit 2 [Hibiscus syriacus]
MIELVRWQSVAAIVFGDGSESRLYPLKKRRSEGAIPIASNYRLIDAVVSNCINSNINKIYAMTQFNSTSLNSHLSRAYSGAGLGKEGFVEVIAAYQSPEDQGWFQGTADAIRRCLWVLEEYPVVEFLVLPGHHLYKMDYQKLIESHRNSKSDITIVASNTMRDEDAGFGVLKINAENQVMQYGLRSDREPQNSKVAEALTRLSETNYRCIPSMGIYLINRATMVNLLNQHFPKAKYFGTEVIRGALSLGMKVDAYLFEGYWEDMRSIEAFYQANMNCIKISNVGYNFCDRDSPVYTMPRYLPPTIVNNAVIMDSVIGDGCILNRCKIKGTVVGMRTKIGDGTTIKDSVIMGSDVYEIEDDGESNTNSKSVPIGIGENTEIKKAIVDKNARIGKNVKIINKDNVEEGEMEGIGYIISGRIMVVLRSAEIPDGSIL